MKAALFDEIDSITLIDKDIPEAKPNEAILKVITTGICGSEIHAYKGTHPFRKPPSILGHEAVGVIEKLGSDVSDFNIGDTVTIEPHYGCGECRECLAGDYHLCNQKTVLGTKKWDGSFAEYMAVPATTIYKLPESLSPSVGVLAEPLAVGVHAVKKADVQKGDKVAVLGAGPIGLLTAVAARSAGAETICITDAMEHNLVAGKEIGATDAVNVKEDSIVDYVHEHVGNVDKVFITIGLKSAADEALQIVKKKGKIVSIAIFEGETGIDLNKVFMSEIEIIGSSMYVKEDFEQAISILQEDKYPLDILTKHQFAMNEINTAMSVAQTKEDGAIKVLINPSHS